MEKKNIKKNSVILVPKFFCGDVENNILNHGYKICYYPVSEKLQTTDKQLLSAIKKFEPKVIIIHHHVGIFNMLLSSKNWLKHVDNSIILIEDCVHRIVEPNQLKFIKQNHFIIDSLRKVVPLQGSVVYGQKNDLNFTQPPFYQSFFYSIRVHFLWILMNLCWKLGANKMAENLMKIGYDLIGDSKDAAPGFFVFNYLQQFLDFEKIKTIKEKQVIFYENNLKNLTNYLQIPPYLKSDRRELIGFPLIINNKIANKYISLLRRKGLLVRAELSDSQWSKKHKIIYLPLGLHINRKQQKQICAFVLLKM